MNNNLISQLFIKEIIFCDTLKCKNEEFKVVPPQTLSPGWYLPVIKDDKTAIFVKLTERYFIVRDDILVDEYLTLEEAVKALTSLDKTYKDYQYVVSAIGNKIDTHCGGFRSTYTIKRACAVIKNILNN